MTSRGAPPRTIWVRALPAWVGTLVLAWLTIGSASAETVADRYMREVLQIFEQHALELPGNWPTLARDARRGASRNRTVPEVHRNIQLLLDRVDDNHSRFFPPDLVADMHKEEEPKREKRPLGTLLTTPLGHSIGYLELPRFSSLSEERVETYARRTRSEIGRLSEATPCGYVVDVRGNTGGNMWAMLDGAAPLLPQGTLGSFVSPSATQWWVLEGETVTLEDTLQNPGELGHISPPQTTKKPESPRASSLSHLPVAVVMGPRTASAGEALAVALTAKKSSRSFGGRSAGLTTSNRGFELSDGALLNLRVSRMGNISGAAHHGALEPNELVSHRTNRRASATPTEPPLAAALNWLEQACSPAAAHQPK